MEKLMSRFSRLLILGLAILVPAASSSWAQNQYIGYVYPAGGQQGSRLPIRLGGQGLVYASDLVVSGEGVSVRLVDFYRVMNNEEMGLLSRQLSELQKQETTLDDVLAAKMSSFEFPTPIGPDTESDSARYLICPICGTANPLDAKLCVKCNAKLDKAIMVGGKAPKSEPSKSEKEAAKQKLIERIQKRFAEDERDPAVPSQTEIGRASCRERV